MSTSCTAFAYAIELSERTLAATAALIGAAMFALTSDICSRSGSCSASCAWSSCSVSSVGRRSGVLSFVMAFLPSGCRSGLAAPLDHRLASRHRCPLARLVDGARHGGVDVGDDVDAVL